MKGGPKSSLRLFLHRAIHLLKNLFTNRLRVIEGKVTKQST